MAKITIEGLMRGSLVNWAQTAPMEEVLALARKVEVGEDGVRPRELPIEPEAEPARRSMRRRRKKKSKGLSTEALAAVKQLLPLRPGSKAYLKERDRIAKQHNLTARQVAGSLNVLRGQTKKK